MRSTTVHYSKTAGYQCAAERSTPIHGPVGSLLRARDSALCSLWLIKLIDVEQIEPNPMLGTVEASRTSSSSSFAASCAPTVVEVFSR
ncbi:hypothetical protein HPP92_013882 [Vanilla planifolia]|uniref:Uncharacterized protein n=1 Tax=Vanilla planifolia TaxID=51239 RepID=A0A835UZ18_VANPL|nr:hypothetical protein HPP92_013882 [Vanilla planifolia]